MDRERLADLLAAVQRGACPVDEALERLRTLPYEDLGFARVDHHRGLRNGFPEVVFGQGKTPEQIVAIAERLVGRGRQRPGDAARPGRGDDAGGRRRRLRVPPAAAPGGARARPVEAPCGRSGAGRLGGHGRPAGRRRGRDHGRADGNPRRAPVRRRRLGPAPAAGGARATLGGGGADRRRRAWRARCRASSAGWSIGR